MLDPGTLGIALIGIGAVGMGVSYGLRLKSVEKKLGFYEELIRHCCAESRAANSTAMKTQRIVNSALNGEEARQVVQYNGPSKGSIERDLLAARIRWRANAGLMNTQELAEVSEEPDGEAPQNAG